MTQSVAHHAKWQVQAVVDPLLISDWRTYSFECEIVYVPLEWADEQTANRLALYSPAWDSLDSSSDVWSAAKLAIDQINRTVELDSDLFERVEIGNIVWQRRDDLERGHSRSVFLMAGTGRYRLEGQPATLRRGDTDPAPRTRGQREKEFSQSNPEFRRALELFKDAGVDIRRLWVVFEYIKKFRNDVGRFSEAELIRRDFANKMELARFAETANNLGNRHRGKEAGELSYPEMPGAEARALIRRLMNSWLDLDYRA